MNQELNTLRLQEVIGFSVSDGILPRCIGPPRRGGFHSFGVRVMGLFLRFHQLDKRFPHHFAGSLLHILEPDGVEFFHFSRVPDSEGLILMLGCNGSVNLGALPLPASDFI
ncbi:hypothetical protein BGZ60DRAFT_68227 [Tricladium varicosporioides]|nr:hypothetical protein BGZ60DRAFT_68227 [Hymenoscyphus varicosporioides]